MNPDIYSTLYKPKPGFKGDIIYDNNDILVQNETLAPDYIIPDTKIKNHNIIINSIDRNWY